jgi:hypothetical protein
MLLHRKRKAACTASKKIETIFYNKNKLKPISSRDAIGKLFFNPLENYIQLEYGNFFYKYR